MQIHGGGHYHVSAQGLGFPGFPPTHIHIKIEGIPPVVSIPTPPEKPMEPEINPALEVNRPTNVTDYVKDFEVTVMVDDSGSMGGNWTNVSSSLAYLARNASSVKGAADIQICFMNRPAQLSGKDEAAMQKFFTDNQASYSYEPINTKLEELMSKYVKELDDAKAAGKLGMKKPRDIIIITDTGSPSEPPGPALAKWATELNSKKYHERSIIILFIFVGGSVEPPEITKWKTDANAIRKGFVIVASNGDSTLSGEFLIKSLAAEK